MSLEERSREDDMRMLRDKVLKEVKEAEVKQAKHTQREIFLGVANARIFRDQHNLGLPR